MGYTMVYPVYPQKEVNAWASKGQQLSNITSADRWMRWPSFFENMMFCGNCVFVFYWVMTGYVFGLYIVPKFWTTPYFVLTILNHHLVCFKAKQTGSLHAECSSIDVE